MTFPDRITKALLLAFTLCHCGGGSKGTGNPGAGASGRTSSTGSGGSGAESSGGSGGGAGAKSGSGGGGGDAGENAWLLAPDGDPPDRLSEVGLFTDLSDLGSNHEAAVPYRPRYPLWTNGSEKLRFVVVPEGETIDTSDREAWQFPTGTLFFKTFSYPDDEYPDGVRPIETRMIRRTEDGFDYHVYLWDDDRSDAHLLDGISTVKVPVELDKDSFEHTVPARLDCRKCHESQPVHIIGFDELRLNYKYSPSDSRTQLEALARAGVLSDAPSDPAAIENEDEETAWVLGYLEGNCAHCHNGSDGPSSAFDMRYPVALENLINQEATSELVSGIRIVPGEPENSALVLAMRGTDIASAQPMPPLGVDRLDEVAISRIESWIANLEPNGAGGAPDE